MKAPKFPSFFNNKNSKEFSFSTRYYDEKKDRRQQLMKSANTKIKFRKKQTNKKQKGRSLTIIFLIIVLSLLAYRFITN